MLCNGALGLDGTDGEHGTSGATALVDKVAARHTSALTGFSFGSAWTTGLVKGLAFNGVLEEDEVRETLNFCFEPLRSERVTDVFPNSGTR